MKSMFTDSEPFLQVGEGPYPPNTCITHVREKVANLTFGGPRRNRLFITANTSLYSVYVAVAGAQVP